VTLAIRSLAAQTAAVAALVALSACGGGGSSPTTPTPGGGSPGPIGATVTIGANGAVSPVQVTIAVGQSVNFVNNDSRVHDMTSDPHPSHTDCPSANAVGLISPGQTKATNAYTTARTCGFHDHGNPNDAALMGRVVIQ
jgi:plastocyanin